LRWNAPVSHLRLLLSFQRCQPFPLQKLVSALLSFLRAPCMPLQPGSKPYPSHEYRRQFSHPSGAEISLSNCEYASGLSHHHARKDTACLSSLQDPAVIESPPSLSPSRSSSHSQTYPHSFSHSLHPQPPPLLYSPGQSRSTRTRRRRTPAGRRVASWPGRGRRGGPVLRSTSGERAPRGEGRVSPR
jgi:hypothetical protein